MSLRPLYYVADPMCSWCWGFRPVLERVLAALPENLSLRYVLGGLAPDSDEPMPEHVRGYVQDAWRSVAVRTGARFNWEFWERCQPRRSTYPSCRAVLAAASQRAGAGPAMFGAIQRAYYEQARNPSLASTLVELAGEIGLDTAVFARDLASPEVEELLQADLALRDRLGVTGFPSLVLETESGPRLLARGYAEAGEVLEALRRARA